MNNKDYKTLDNIRKETIGKKTADLGRRIFAQDCDISNNSFETHLNNHDILLGGSGSGKTTVVLKNLISESTTESLVVTDVKGTLYRQTRSILEARGYKVHIIDFNDPDNGESYDVLRSVRSKQYGNETVYSECDLFTIAAAICPEENTREPFWEQAAQQVLVCLMSYVLGEMVEEERNLTTVIDLYRLLDIHEDSIPQFLEEYVLTNPDSLTTRLYESIKKMRNADRTWSCILGMLGSALAVFESREIRSMMQRPKTFDFEQLGREKTALFINVSDIDRAFDRIINIMYNDILLKLCRSAEKCPDGRLPVPVRLWFDDYAASCNINNMDKLISVLRSRNISVSLILQSVSQLRSVYSEAKAATICSNADHILYLGGVQGDIATMQYLADRTGTVPENIYSLPEDMAMLITRGERKPGMIRKLDPAEVNRELGRLNELILQQSL